MHQCIHIRDHGWETIFCMLCSSDSHASSFMHETNEEMVRHHWAVIFTIAEPNDGF
jgi:hypothetical protein